MSHPLFDAEIAARMALEELQQERAAAPLDRIYNGRTYSHYGAGLVHRTRLAESRLGVARLAVNRECARQGVSCPAFLADAEPASSAGQAVPPVVSMFSQ